MNEQMHLFRDRWQAVAAIEAEETKTASVAAKWDQMNAIYRLAMGLQLSIEQDESENVVYMRWARLKEQVS